MLPKQKQCKCNLPYINNAKGKTFSLRVNFRKITLIEKILLTSKTNYARKNKTDIYF